MRAVLLLGVVACGPGRSTPTEGEVPAVQVDTWLEGASAEGGVLVVQTTFDPVGEVTLPQTPEGRLQFQAVDDPTSEQVGARRVVTQRYRFTGQGSHEIPGLEATWTGPSGEVKDASRSLFVDLGVEPPREGELADILEPGRIWTVPWGAVAAVGGVGGLMVGGVWWALRGARPRVVVLERPDPPDVAALKRWDAVRVDPKLDAEAKATELSLLFRVYAEAVLAFPATAWTTTEIVKHLEEMRHLPMGNVPRARRLLRATDRVKYADARATAELFEELDADLRAFVGSTRPQRWGEVPK